MIELLLIRPGHPYWEKTAEFARTCSWSAGPLLARRMRENDFLDWERVVVAVEDGRITGFCTFCKTDELPERCGLSPFIGFVFVAEKYRGQRISQQMIQAALRYAKEFGFSEVYLVSGERGLYEKYGFEKIGEEETLRSTVEQVFRIHV